MAGYIGGRVAISSPQQIETKHTLTATASQTSIPNISYTVGAVHVYQNGVRLVDGTDFTATNGSTVTLETGATEGDQIVIVSHGSFETGDVVSKASGGTFSAGITANGDITASSGTVLVTGDTSAGDDAAIGYTSAEGLILTGQGTTNDVTIKNDADAAVMSVPTGTTGATFAGSIKIADAGNIGSASDADSIAIASNGVVTFSQAPVFPDGSLNLADLDIDGGTDIGAALVDADLMIVDDGAGGTNRKATMSRLATYMGTKIGGGLEFIATADVSNAATANFTGFDSNKYDSYLFTCGNIVPASDAQFFRVRMSVDGGSNYLSASDSYRTDAVAGIGAGDKDYIPLTNNNFGNVSTEGGSLDVRILNPNLNTSTYVFADGIMSHYDNTVYANQGRGGKTKAATVVNAIQFFFASGNIASGTITMYGMVNS